MLEYEETDPTKFNEDGSFIGQYGGKTKKEEKMEPDATSPSALSTFVQSHLTTTGHCQQLGHGTDMALQPTPNVHL